MRYQLLDELHNCIFICDRDTLRFTYASNGALAQLGYSMDELREMTPLDLKPEFDEASYRALVAPVLAGTQPTVEFETVHRRRDGSLILVDAIVQIVGADSDTQLAVVARDITEQKAILTRLERSEALNRAVLETAIDGIVVIDANGLVQSFNGAAEKMFGWRADEVIGRNVNILMPSPYHEEHDGYLARYRETAEKRIIGIGRIVEGRHRDGSKLPLHLSVSEMHVGGELLFAGIVRDPAATERVAAELRESQHFLASIVDNLPTAVVVKDATELRYVQINRSGEELVGRSRDEILGKTGFDLYPADQAAIFDADDRQVLETGQVLDIAVLGILTAHRGQRLLHTVKVPIFDDGGRPLYLLSISEDITEQSRTEELLRERQRTLQAVFQASADVIAILDSDFVIEDVNSAIERTNGIPAAQRRGHSVLEFVHPDDRARVDAALHGVLEQNVETARFSYRIHHADGRWVPVEANVRVLLDDAGQASGLVLVRHDISDALAAQQMLEDAKAEAERANLAKSEFLSRMSHELRTPLNSVIGFAQILEMTLTSDDDLESVRYIYKAGEHLLDLINEVLDISRIESGTMTVSLEPVSLELVVQDCLALVAPQAAERDIEIIDHDGRGHHVRADRQRLKQVLLNLLSNAIKFNHDHGSVTVSCATRDGWARLAVTDTGPGLSAELQERLFVAFDRLGADHIEGTGLGLALSKRLVEAMGGTLGVDTARGQGSTFFIELPIAPTEERAEERARISRISQLTRSHDATLLCIEDNLVNLNLIEHLLEGRPGTTLLSALQGSIGIELATQHRPDLILLDLHLPDISGNVVLGRLRADPRTADIPVIVVSADATQGQIRRLRDSGANDYVTKPIDVARFLELLDEYLGGPDTAL